MSSRDQPQALWDWRKYFASVEAFPLLSHALLFHYLNACINTAIEYVGQFWGRELLWLAFFRQHKGVWRQH